jgi:hypothetical protein
MLEELLKDRSMKEIEDIIKKEDSDWFSWLLIINT